MNRFGKWAGRLAKGVAALGLALQLGILASSPASAADVTLNALFMKQAAYSEDDEHSPWLTHSIAGPRRRHLRRRHRRKSKKPTRSASPTTESKGNAGATS